MHTLHRFVIVGGMISIVIALVLGLSIDTAFAENSNDEGNAVASAQAHQTWALALGAALSAGAGCLGAAYAVGKVGAAVMGAASEKPELLTRALVFVALGEGIAILGMVIAVLLIQQMPG